MGKSNARLRRNTPLRRRPGREHHARNLAKLIAGAARHPRSQSVCYDAAESYHVPRDRGSIAAAIIAGMRQSQQAAPLGRKLPGQREEKESERLGAEQAGHHGDQRSGVTWRWASRDFYRTN
jgi:hypothetical protein